MNQNATETKNSKCVLCFDIGGTSIKYAVVAGGKILDDTRGSFATDVGDGQAMLDKMCDVCKKYIDGENFNIRGISFSTPGFADNKTGQIVAGNIIDGFNGLNLRDYFKSKFNINVALENDANCAAIAEHGAGAGVGYDNLCVVTCGTGIGGGVIINGKIYDGNNFSAGEFGFMFLNGLGFACEDGQLPENQIMSAYASTSSLCRFYELKTGKTVDGKQVFAAADAGDVAAAQAIDRMCENLARGIWNICYTISPQCVLIGGGVSARPEIIEGIKKYLHAWKPSFATDLCDVVKIGTCKFLNDAGLVGAYYNFIDS